MRQVEGDDDRSSQSELGKAMEEHIKKVMVDIGLTIKEQMHPLVKSAYYLKARFALIEPPFVRAVEQARRMD